MDESELEAIASQLSCPQGEDGLEMGNKMNVLNAFITSRTIEALAPQKSEIVAELGPGNGALSEPVVNILGQNGKYFGIEPSEVMANEARNRLADNGCAVDIICSDHMGADIPESSLDGIMAVNVLYFIKNLDEFFTQIKSWMKPGSRAVFGIRSDQSLKKLPFTQYEFIVRNQEEIKDSMIMNGFSDVESNYFDEGTVMLGEMALPVDSIIIKGVI